MDKYQERLRDIAEIRAMMEQSTRFLSLSGLSGISSGVIALIGAGLTYQYLVDQGIYNELSNGYYRVSTSHIWTLMGFACAILIAALAAASFFSLRLAQKKGERIWNPTTRRLSLNLLIPLIAGAIFCFQLAWYGFPALVAPATLIFYGVALLNAGKYTFREVRLLGISEITLGIISSFFLGQGILFWSIGFGVLHILYGIVMYLTYER